jgi:uncharacterized protein YbaA (DUF1428 family)
MSKYADVYLLPILTENVPAYKKMAAKAGKVFLKHGALRYREYVASDLNVVAGMVPFTRAVQLKPGETLVYAAVEFKSEAHRNKAMKAIFEDTELGAMMDGKPLFDYKRMVYGGFAILVDL